MRLPPGRLHQVFGCDAARPLQQVQNFGGFCCPRGRLFRSWISRPRGALLAELAFLPALAFFGATLARRAPGLALLVALRSGASRARAVYVVSVSDVMLFLLVGMSVRTSITPFGRDRKTNL
jgi:hypothetical protein